MSYRGGDCSRGSSKPDRERERNREKRRDRSDSREKSKYRSRSRSRERKPNEDSRKSDYKTDSRINLSRSSLDHSSNKGRSSSRSPSPPPPPIISKISMEFKGGSSKPQSVKMQLNPLQGQVKPPAVKKPTKVASVFADNSDDEPEEMPPEARMRMRNIGRDTPTSAGPNSYGKTKHGFCNQKAITQKTLKVAMEEVAGPPSQPSKLPGTIYKLSR